MDTQKVAEFISITGSDDAAAQFYLEAAGGDVQGAISSFFDNDGAVPAATPASQPQPASQEPVIPRQTEARAQAGGSAPTAAPA